MGEIIRAQLFGLRRKKLITVLFVLLAALMLVRVFFASNAEDMTGCVFFAEELSSAAFIAYIFVFAAAGTICADDFPDRTVNFELMSGHTRNEVYFGRAAVSAAVSAAGGAALTALPVAAAAVIFGWNGPISAGQVMLRFFLLTLIYARMACEFTFLAFVVKNPYIVYAAGYLWMFFAQTFIPGESVLTGLSSITAATRFGGWMVYDLSGNFHSVYSGTMAKGDIIPTVISSVVSGALFIAMGRIFFEKDDLN